MESFFSPGFLQLEERPLQLVRSYLQLEKNWSDVLEKIVTAVNLWRRGNLSLKGVRAMSHIHLPLLLYCLSVQPLPPADLGDLVGALFRLL